MSNLTTPYIFSNGTAADATQVDANFAAIETLLNSTGLDSTGLASSSVTTAKIVDASVTQAKLAARTSGTSVAAGGVALSATCGVASVSGTSKTDITNLSVTIVTTGRPVFVGLVSDGSGSLGSIGANGTVSVVTAKFALVRDSTEISYQTLFSQTGTSDTKSISAPPSSLWHLDVVGSGTYTYKAQYQAASLSTNVSANYVKLVAYEI